MSKWESIAFADVKVLDTIKSVSPCGTVRRGVVKNTCADMWLDADNNMLAIAGWTLTRRVPKPAKTPLLPIPVLGQRITATRKNGEMRTGCVTREMGPNYRAIDLDGEWFGFMRAHPVYDNDIIAWDPAEPMTFGYVGFVTEPSGDISSVSQNAWGRYDVTSQSNGDTDDSCTWLEVRALGTFTAA